MYYEIAAWARMPASKGTEVRAPVLKVAYSGVTMGPSDPLGRLVATSTVDATWTNAWGSRIADII